MAKIVSEIIMEVHQEGRLDERPAWAVIHLCEMVQLVRNRYYAPDDAT
jgi:hypothetical protein